MELCQVNICATCLSSDRRLEPINKMRNVLKEIKFEEIERFNATGICWECRGNIMKFHRFRTKALKAQASFSQNLRLQDMTSLSSLVVNYQFSNNTDPLTNCDSQPKLEMNIIKEELDANVSSKEIKEIDTNTNANIKQVSPDNTSTFENAVINGNDSIVNYTKIMETGDPNDVLDNDDEDVTELDENVMNTNEVENKTGVDTNNMKNLMNREETKVDRELAGKFIRIIFSEEEIKQNREDKRKHYNFKKLPFKCDSCVLGFTKEEKLNKHMEKKHDESIGVHKCDICEIRFATASAVLGHRWRHYSCYRCRFCKYETTELRCALNHCKIKHKRDHLDSIHCTQCDTVVKIAGELEEHVQSEHSLHCTECGVKFKGKHTLRNHKARIHANIREYICDICTKTFTNKTRLESHMAGHNTAIAKSLSYCHQCKVQYKNINVYRSHLKNSANHSERKFSCPECNKKFASKVYGMRHYNFYHLRTSQYNCDICNKLFISDWRLKNHRQKHHGLSRPRNHPCNICGKKFFVIITQPKIPFKPEPIGSKQKEARIALFTAMHTSIRVVDYLGEVINHSHEKNIEKVQLHRIKCTSIIKNVLELHFTEILKQDFKDQPFSLLIDESIDIAVNKYLGLIIIYYSKLHQIIVSTYLDLAELDECNAEGIVSAIKKTLKRFDLRLENLMGIGTDNASVMVGVNNGVYIKLKEELPHLILSISNLRNHKLIHSEQRRYLCSDCGDTFKQRPALYTHVKLVHGDGRRK